MPTQTEIKLVSVNALNLTPGDLRNSKLPDTSVRAISVAFKSATGLPYTVTHNRLPSENHVLLYGEAKNEIEDFRNVASFVSRIIKIGIGPEGEITPRTIGTYSDISQVMSLPNPLTQKLVAGYVEGYMRLFHEVTIPIAYYRNVPLKDLQNPGFPVEKLCYK